MKKILLIVFISATLASTELIAGEHPFAETAEAIIEQLAPADKPAETFGKTRSFAIGEMVPTRSIEVRRKNSEGGETTATVQVPVAETERAARLKVEFAVNSAQLRSSAYTILDELAKALENERIAGRIACIKGHTDSDGLESHNLQLSFDRANSVKHYLQTRYNIPAERLQVFGYGEAMPLYANDSLTHKQANRRVEIALDCAESKGPDI